MEMSMEGLELVKRNDDLFYWALDYRYTDNLSGVYLVSIDYGSDREAVNALISNEIIWEIEGDDD